MGSGHVYRGITELTEVGRLASCEWHQSLGGILDRGSNMISCFKLLGFPAMKNYTLKLWANAPFLTPLNKVFYQSNRKRN